MADSNGKEKQIRKECGLPQVEQITERSDLMQKLEEEAKRGIALSCFDVGSLLINEMEHEKDWQLALEFWRKGYELDRQEQKDNIERMRKESITCLMPRITVDLSSLFIFLKGL